MTQTAKGTSLTSVQHSFERLISLAIQREEEAYAFYTEMAEIAELKSSAKLLEELAAQEALHKKKLEEGLGEGVCDTFTCSQEEMEDMGLSDYLLEVPIDPSSGPQDVLIVAMKREENSRDFYNVLSELTSSTNHRTVFEALAKEEQKHKDRLEDLYDKIFQPDM